MLDKSYGCLIGLAIGDALGSPTEGMSPAEIKKKYGRIDDFLDESSGTDDTEFAVLTAKILIDQKGKLSYENLRKGWLSYLANEKEFIRAGQSELEAIKNLKEGIKPPESGLKGAARESDGAAMRIAPVGIYCAGNPTKAAELAEKDASVSHAKIGISCAQALAASIAKAFSTNNKNAIIKTGLDWLQSNSKSLIKKILKASEKYSDPFNAIDELYRLRSKWSWWAPEALGYSYAFFKLSRNFKETVLSAANFGRDADTIAAMAGASGGIKEIPAKWVSQCRQVKGVCIKKFRDVDLKSLAKKLRKLVVN